MTLLQKMRTLFVLPILLLTILTTPRAADTDTARFVSQKVFVMDQALAMGQGITTDGTYFYTSGAATALRVTYLAKIDIASMAMTAKHLNPLPQVCKERGNNHIGGISYYNGRLYASVEGGDVCKACIAVFDPETLTATGEVCDLPNEIFDDGIPWLAVDPATGYLYASQWNHAKTVYVYDVNDGMALVKELPLTGVGELHRIQGGEFRDGTLYLSQDSKDEGTMKRLLALDTATGKVTVAARRNVGGTNIESEGMTFLTKDGKTSLWVLDYNKAVGIFLREYDLTPAP